MSAKGSITTTDYLDFDKTLNLSFKTLKNDNQYKIAFLIIVGINTGLRISDILSLKHSDFKGDFIELKEKKTNKYRKITLNDNIRKGYKMFCSRLGVEVSDEYVFVSQKNSVYSIMGVNRELKRILGDSKGKLNVSSHSLRKTFGRRVFQNNNENEKSLIYLSELFNHSNTSITRRYLGIRQQELSNIYINL